MLSRIGKTEGEIEDYLPCTWSRATALDPRHRPQLPKKTATTVRREWSRWPQEAHLLDKAKARYRRLTTTEIALLQGFPSDWLKNSGLSISQQIAGLGNAVPPPLAEAVFLALARASKRKLKTSLEVCAGLGGLALGLHRALSTDILGLVDSWSPGLDVLSSKKLCNPSKISNSDVRDWKAYEPRKRVDILCGGPPCQPWSRGGLGKGIQDTRDLLGFMPYLTKQIMPKAFVFENVAGLMEEKHKPYLQKLLRRLSMNGTYGVSAKILQAANYGVPQQRKRVFIIGLKDQSDFDVQKVFEILRQNETHSRSVSAFDGKGRPWTNLAEVAPGWEHRGVWRRWKY